MSITMPKKAGSFLFQSPWNWLVSSPRRAFLFIFILAFGMRAYWLLNYPPEYSLTPGYGRELGAIARSLAGSGQFANPYIVPTGPTAHLPPLIPAIVALIYILFGTNTVADYVFIGYTIMSISLMYAMAPWIADRAGLGKPVGFLAGLAGAYLLGLQWTTHAEALAGVLLVLIMVAFLTRWGKQQSSLSGSLLLGLGIGASFHVQPALLLVFLGYLAFEIVWLKGKRKWVITGMLVLGVVLACVPWAWRNYVVFHEIFFIRSNLGLELRMGNHNGAAVAMDTMDRNEARMGAHPRLDREEAIKLKELGEMEYMRQARREALSWMVANPGKFIKLTFLRFILFWLGPLYSGVHPYIALLTFLAFFSLKDVVPALTVPQRVVILVPLITFPLIYYLVPYMPRYRIPIDWMILLLGSAEILHLIKAGRQDHSYH